MNFKLNERIYRDISKGTYEMQILLDNDVKTILLQKNIFLKLIEVSLLIASMVKLRILSYLLQIKCVVFQ